MTGYCVGLSELGHMSLSEESQVLTQLVRHAKGPRNGQIAGISAAIRAFEHRYEMSSAELVEGLKAGVIRETADISEWLFLLSARDHRVGG